MDQPLANVSDLSCKRVGYCIGEIHTHATLWDAWQTLALKSKDELWDLEHLT